MRVYLYYYAHINLGDDLFVKILTDRYKDSNVKFYTITAPSSVKNLKCKNLRNLPVSAIIYYGLKRMGSKAKMPILTNLAGKYKSFLINRFFDASVEIGGSIFVQEREKEYYLNCSANPPHKKHSYIIGANVGPFTDEAFIEYVNNSFRQYSGICLRDTFSYNLISDKSNVKAAPDVIFNLKTEKGKLESSKNILICPIDPRSKNVEADCSAYYKELGKISDSFAAKGYKVHLISFCKSEGDEIAVEKIYGCAADKSSISKICYDGSNFECIKSLFENTDFVIACRFHSMILALNNEKPVFPICYSTKTSNYLKDIDFKGKFCRLDEISKYAEAVNYNISSAVTDISVQRESAHLQFSYLDKFISD